MLERELEATASYLDCFKGSNLIRTEISVMVYLIQVIGGNPLIGYANFFFEQAGLNPAESFDMGVGNTALGFVGSCLSWPLMSWFGRRTLYIGGMVVTTTLILVIGFLDFGKSNSNVQWAQASIMDLWTFFLANDDWSHCLCHFLRDFFYSTSNPDYRYRYCRPSFGINCFHRSYAIYA